MMPEGRCHALYHAADIINALPTSANPVGRDSTGLPPDFVYNQKSLDLDHWYAFGSQCVAHLDSSRCRRVMIRTRTLRSYEGLSEGLVQPPRLLHSMDSNRVFYYENKGKFVRGLPRTQVLSLFSKRAIRSQSTSVMTVEIMIDTPPSVSERGLPPGRLKKVEQRTRAAK
jgi:hypothetical protein